MSTTIEQSQRLLEIGVKPDTADMVYLHQGTKDEKDYYSLDCHPWDTDCDSNDIPAWSLSALLKVLPSMSLDKSDSPHFRANCVYFSEWYDNPIDAVMEIIERLYKNGYLGKED